MPFQRVASFAGSYFPNNRRAVIAARRQQLSVRRKSNRPDHRAMLLCFENHCSTLQIPKTYAPIFTAKCQYVALRGKPHGGNAEAGCKMFLQRATFPAPDLNVSRCRSSSQKLSIKRKSYTVDVSRDRRAYRFSFSIVKTEQTNLICISDCQNLPVTRDGHSDSRAFGRGKFDVRTGPNIPDAHDFVPADFGQHIAVAGNLGN